MARGIRKRGAALFEEVTYFLLIKETSRAAQLSARQHVRARGAVTGFVKKEKGTCKLYQTSGGVYDFISIVTNISPAAAVRMANEINQAGVVKATLVMGLIGPHIFK